MSRLLSALVIAGLLGLAACATSPTVRGQVPGAGPMGPNTYSPSLATAPGTVPAPPPGTIVVPQGTPAPPPTVTPTETSPIPAPSAPRITAPTAASTGVPEFTFQVGDQLEVSVWNEKELTTTHTVMRDGTVPAKGVGNVRVLGRNIEDVRSELTAKYGTFLVDPRVSIRVLSVYSDRVFVLGEVSKPAAVPMQGRTTVMQAIAQAGGFVAGSANLRTIRIVRKLPGQPQRIITANAESVLRSGRRQTLLQPGDVVYVHPTGLADWSRRLTQLLGPIGSVVGSASGVVAAVAVSDNNN